MTQIAPGWQLHFDTSNEWIFFVLSHEPLLESSSPPLAEKAWELMAEQSRYRGIVELGPDVMLTSYLVGQLVLLHRRACQAGGVLRICGFSTNNYNVFKAMRLDDRFFNYRSREAAVMGYRE